MQSKAKKLGLAVDKHACSYKVKPYHARSRPKLEKTIGEEDFIPLSFQDIQLKNYSNQVNHEDITESSPYVEIDGDKRLVVKKTFLVWYLRKDCQKLSNDRLLRVQGSREKNVHKRKKKQKKVIIYRYKLMKMRKK